MTKNENNWYVITGTLSSGKTTVINKLKERGFKTVPELARVYIDNEIEHGNTVEELRSNELEFQQAILQMKIDVEKELDPKEIIFFDRGIPDSVAYYELSGLYDDAYLDAAVKNSSYVKVFLLDPVKYKKDYARIETEKERMELHVKLKDAYEHYGFDVVHVPVFDTKYERVDFILEHIGK